MMFCNSGLAAALMNAECEIRKLELLNENLRGQIDGLKHLLNQREIEVKGANAACKKLMDSMREAKQTAKVSGGNKITYPERVKVYDSALHHWGADAQALKAIEELAEVIIEIAKWWNNIGDIEHLAEETADATIMLEQLRLMHDINEKVSKYMDEKVERLAKRIREEVDNA